MERDIIIEASDIGKSYPMSAGVLRVLKGISIEIREGETVAVTGPSGAGKSTLLHILGGLDQPTDGRVAYRGRDMYAMPPRQRTALRAAEIGFVFQSFHLLPELDVLENVMLPAMALWGRKAAAARRRAMDLLGSVGLAGRATHTPTELSGGEQQRAALARALMNDPAVVLADEPTGNLDTATGAQVLDCLFALTRDRRHTLVIVTHNPDLAARCQRTFHLVDGAMAG